MGVVTDAELAHEILVKHPKVFIKSKRDISVMAAFLGDGLVTNRSITSHKTHRKMIQPGFHFRKIQSFAETMIAYAERYLEDWQADEERLVSDDMFRLSMFIVSKTLFNMDIEDMIADADRVGAGIELMQEILDSKYKSIAPMPINVPTPANLKLRKIRQMMEQLIERMVESKRDPQGEIKDEGDLLSMLMLSKYEDGSALTREHIMDELITLFVAGHETTSNAMTWALHLLAEHPDSQDRLAAELQEVLGDRPLRFEDLDKLVYTEMVIKEAMRLFPPAWTLSNREVAQEIELKGYHFPKGKVLFIAPYAFHHCERYFPNAKRFDPERFSEAREKSIYRHAYIPFGSGPRVCIGNSFAMMEAKVVLASVIRRYQVESLENQKIKIASKVTLSNEGGLSLRVKKRL